MDVYVLFIEADESPLSVYESLAGAMAASPGDWVADITANGVWMRDIDDVLSPIIFKTELRP